MKINFKPLAIIFLLIFVVPAGFPPPAGSRQGYGADHIEDAISALKEAPAEKRDDARQRLEEMAHQNPHSDLADNALLECAQSYLSDADYEAALKLLNEIIQNYPDSDSAPEARYLAGYALVHLNRMEDAARVLQEVRPKDHRYADASILYINALLRLGLAKDAFKRYSELVKVSPDRAKEVEENLAKPLEKLSNDDLSDLLEGLGGSSLKGNVLFILGERAYNHGDFLAARGYMTKLLAQQPKFPRADKARAIIAEIENVGSINVNAIGLLLPMSGKWAPYGKKFMEAAALAVGAFSPNPEQGVSIRLEVMDTSDDPATAAEAAKELIVNKRVIAIAGPVQSDSAKAAAEVAQAYGVPIITMTQLEDVTKIGDMVFRNSVTPRDQARTLAWYATSSMGVKSFAILFPDHSFGRLLQDMFSQEVKKLGGNIVLSLPYKPGQSDLRHEIEEISKRKREIQGLYIPDTYLAAVTIAPQLTYYNVVRIKLFGSSGWNSPKLIELAQGQMSSIEGAIFPDAFFPDSTNAITQAFTADFQDAYDRKPDMYEALGYETVRILIETIKTQGVKDQLAMRDALGNLKNFPTFSGPLSARPDRSFYRPLFLLQVRDGQITEITAQGQM